MIFIKCKTFSLRGISLNRGSGIGDDLTSCVLVDNNCAGARSLLDFNTLFADDGLGFCDDKDDCLGFGDDSGERLDPSLSILLTLSREAFRLSGGKAFLVLLIGEIPFPSGGSGAY